MRGDHASAVTLVPMWKEANLLAEVAVWYVDLVIEEGGIEEFADYLVDFN